LVAHAFLGKCPDDCEVNHKDAIKANNQASNLEYLTHRANINHAVSAGIWNRPAGETHCHAVLTDDLVREIRRRAKTEPVSAIARDLGMPYPTIYSAASGKSWAHVKEAA
jgi:hypothetical protein